MAKIRTAHGVRGLVKLDCYNEDPGALPDYNPLLDSSGTREFTLKNIARHKTFYLAEIDGVTDRTEAENLRNTELFIPRDRLPEVDEDDTYYHIDLVGLKATENNKEIGIVKSVQNFGAGDLLEIEQPDGELFYIPFKDEFVPDVDLEAGTVSVISPLYSVEEE